MHGRHENACFVCDAHNRKWDDANTRRQYVVVPRCVVLYCIATQHFLHLVFFISSTLISLLSFR